MSQYTLDSYPLTSVYHREPIESSETNDVLIFIPGNPGLIEYYAVYLELLQQKHPNFDIYCISHAGYQTTDDYVAEGSKREYGYYNLQYQIKHKVDIIAQIVKEKTGTTRLHLYGHSVGSYVLQRVARRLLSAELPVKIEFLGLICPTVINIRHSSSGQKLVFLATYMPIVQLGMALVWFFSFFFSHATVQAIIRNWIFTKPTDDDPKAHEAFENSVVATAKLGTSKRIVHQALTMAIEEMEMILEDDELNDWFFRDLPAQGTKIWVYFAFTDHWVHDNTRNYILSRYHDEQNRNLKFQLGQVDDGISHSFCVDQSVEFSKITLETLASLQVD